MAIKSLNFLRKKIVKAEPFEVSHLIVGNDLWALALYSYLKQKEYKVAWISESDLIERSFPGPAMLRGKDNADFLTKHFPGTNLKLVEAPSSFFREQRFREFGGRSKSEQLLAGEEYFVLPRYEYSWEEICNFRLDDQMEFHHGIVAQIEKEGDQSFRWLISCADGKSYRAQHLFWGMARNRFLSLLQNQNQYSDAAMQIFTNEELSAAIYVRYQFDHMVSDMEQTIFIPLSYTYDWGHFIGEFRKSGNGGQEIEFVHHVFPDQTSEEDISRKIKILDKSLEKIFQISDLELKEKWIKVQSGISSQGFNDSFLNAFNNEFPQVKFLGFEAPLPDGRDDICYLARGAVALKEIIKQF